MKTQSNRMRMSRGGAFAGINRFLGTLALLGAAALLADVAGAADRIKPEGENRESPEQARQAVEAMHRQFAEINNAYLKTVFDSVPRKLQRSGSMPLGGIGTGGMTISADGGFSLAQFAPVGAPVDSKRNVFGAPEWMGRGGPAVQAPFVVRARAGNAPLVARLLKSGPNRVKEMEFYGEFPIAYHRFNDNELPVRVSMESFSPFIPLDEKNSGLPVAMFFLTAENPGSGEAEVMLLSSLPSALGDPVAPLKVGQFSGVKNGADG